MGQGLAVTWPRATLALPRGGASLAYRDSLGFPADEPLMLLHGLGVTG